MSRIGFFGGSFNPPTLAHKEIVEKAKKELNLDKIIIVPMGDMYQKNGLIPFENRFDMLNILFKNDETTEISRLQSNQKEISYAIDSFEKIDNMYKDDDRFFIMGLDNFSKINEWKDSNKLLNNRKYIVVKRDNINFPKDAKNVSFLHLNLNSSSSLARQMIKNGQDLNEVLDDNVINYINNNGLYKEIK